MYEMNVEKEKAALEEAVRKRKEEEQKARRLPQNCDTFRRKKI